MQKSAKAVVLVTVLGAALALASAPPASAAVVQVNIQNAVFTPSTVNIQINDTVVFLNMDSFNHDVILDSGPSSGAQAGLAPGANWSHTFTAAGTIKFRCREHSSSFDTGMVGKVVATDPNATAPPPPRPQPGFELPAALAAIGAVAFVAARRRSA